jgi:hypothetical protein
VPVEHVEVISSQRQVLAYVIRSQLIPTHTLFITPPELKQQVGFVVYSAGTDLPRHLHRPLCRRIVGTSEVLIVREGQCLMDVYTDDRNFVASRELKKGDIVVFVAGGHGFRMLEDTVFLEVKQGPYTGIEEKERF